MKEVGMRSTHAELLNLSSALEHVAMEKQSTFLILRLSEERSLGHDRLDGDCHLVNPFGIVLLSLQSPLARSSGGLQADNFCCCTSPVSGKRDRRIFLVQHTFKSLTLAEISGYPANLTRRSKRYAQKTIININKRLYIDTFCKSSCLAVVAGLSCHKRRK